MTFLEKLLLLAVSFLTFSFASCDDKEDEQDVLKIDTEEVDLGPDELSGEFTLSTTASSWEIGNPDAEWLELSEKSGTSVKATITVEAEDKSLESRTAVLTIRAGNAEPVEITVNQASSEYLYSLDAGTKDISLKMTGGSESFELLSTAPEWEIETDAGWLEFNKTSGTASNETITVSAGKNETGSERNTKMILTAEYAPPVEISVSQTPVFPSYNTSPKGPDMTGVEKTAPQLCDEMKIGWNIGNTLEVPASDGGETGWGNPEVTRQLIDEIKETGFNAIRIPCAWNSYADQETAEIDQVWLQRVKEVVDYCIENEMYVILNSHWDGGWLEENPVYDRQEEVNLKQKAFWEQVASCFRDYDERLLFAGTNEVREDYGEPSSENIEVQESYNQTFVDAVRSTGGKNAYRNLIVQTYNTNIDHGLEYFSLPEDEVEKRLMVEVHYYDPYNFTLNSDMDDACTRWGEPFAGGDVCDWGQESHVDAQFKELKETYIDQGIPVIIGEYGAIHRASLSGEEYDKHVEARSYYLEYVTQVAVNNGITPFYWDNGHDGDEGFALFDRSSGEVVDEPALSALMKGAGVIE
ncbi:MAG: cellulase family glycosylhydrolase [Marinilabilia sp.]